MARHFLLILLLAIPFSLTARAATPLQVSDAWVRAAPPGTTVLAGYMTVSNPGKHAVVVDSVTSPDFGAVEIHRTVVEQGIARMLPVEQLDIRANDRVVLQPGSFHLMMFDPARPLPAGDEVTLLLHTRRGQCIRVSAPVIRATGNSHHHPHH